MRSLLILGLTCSTDRPDGLLSLIWTSGALGNEAPRRRKRRRHHARVLVTERSTVMSSAGQAASGVGCNRQVRNAAGEGVGQLGEVHRDTGARPTRARSG